jgi:hypothetical protein
MVLWWQFQREQENNAEKKNWHLKQLDALWVEHSD